MCDECTENAWIISAEDEQARIIKLLEENAQGEYKQIMLTPKLIELIKGENKATSWTSRPITEEDIESYGIEGEK